MARFAWCIEGRHVGSDPAFSKECPGTVGKSECSCDCHKPAEPRFVRRARK